MGQHKEFDFGVSTSIRETDVRDVMTVEGGCSGGLHSQHGGWEGGGSVGGASEL